MFVAGNRVALQPSRYAAGFSWIGLLTAFIMALVFAPNLQAQEQQNDPRASTGGAQTLEDILARQRGETVPKDFRRLANGRNEVRVVPPELQSLGGTSDPEFLRQLRFSDADVNVSARGPAAHVVMQDQGIWWLNFRKGPLANYGGRLLVASIVVIAFFYVIRGRIRIDGPVTGRKILRFGSIERFGHWLLAGSFILLGITGLLMLFGRKGLIPLLGKEGYASIAQASIYIHNSIAWAFILGLIMIFFMWLVHNIPNRHDLKWMAMAGGLFSKGVHPPARKFNAGQKLIFWSVIVLGGSISISGVSLLLPFEWPLFSHTFALINATHLPDLFGFEPLPEFLLPHEEMQFAQIWHAAVAFVLMAIIIAHIYIGSVGMEGAIDAMYTGEVEEQWAREHHGLWVRELEERKGDPEHRAAE
jgi:formate dehydrogenase subunit gamma